MLCQRFLNGVTNLQHHVWKTVDSFVLLPDFLLDEIAEEFDRQPVAILIEELLLCFLTGSDQLLPFRIGAEEVASLDVNRKLLFEAVNKYREGRSP